MPVGTTWPNGNLASNFKFVDLFIFSVDFWGYYQGGAREYY
jgi:hypothetical protein